VKIEIIYDELKNF